ncbi:hypothetical protein [Enterococcus caccae]|uniref:Uncharacterized protein n=1 Tax=Enterococcus caccae ATCC BAA-1240 TaxID=1158612 RepID=R3WNB1_9ENTE|nr:hypothetical protein [Enterococcus caccae]EOL49336.1 hypothetical protein UC7_00713 [Enterococcus caccae ATCC BAA-1240]EOT56388.1 hypothetical protein I580_03188 [Enterococcus caccae ATCC BAA-1240]
MAERVISTANLSAIENNLSAIHNNIDAMNGMISTVDGNVQVVYQELAELAKEFHDYVQQANKQHKLELAETRLVKIRQEIEKKFGHYGEIRRTATGVLQADDLEIVRKETIETATEELMLSAPGYWLAPCLVAVSAWISNKQELAERAIKEAIRRDDEKTSLLFALVCRRADRKAASLKWTQRYFANQNEEELNRETIIIIDAFASGLLGVDTEGMIARQLMDWLENISAKAGFEEQLIVQWSEAIKLHTPVETTSNYPYLKKYSSTWLELEAVLKGAHLHEVILDYFQGIFNKEASKKKLVEQLDDILFTLVSEFDEEELPFRQKERLNELIIDHNGDEEAAKRGIQVEETNFTVKKDFSQLLTDAAMKPENSGASVSTQKFAIALSKNWIINAYNDVAAENRAKVPTKIQCEVNKFIFISTDGSGEQEVLADYEQFISSKRDEKLASLVLPVIREYGVQIGAVIGGIGLLMMITGNPLFGILAAIAGIWVASSSVSEKKKMTQVRAQVKSEYDQQIITGKEIIRAILAEIVDFRQEFELADARGNEVIDYLEQISPDQYVQKLSGSIRRIKIDE